MSKRAAVIVLVVLALTLPVVASAQAGAPTPAAGTTATAAPTAPAPAGGATPAPATAPGATPAPAPSAVRPLPLYGSTLTPPTGYFGSDLVPAAPVVPPPPEPVTNFETVTGLGVLSASGAVQFLFQWRQEDANQPKLERFLTRRVQLALYGRPAEKVRYGIVADAIDGDLVNPAANGFELQVREAWIGFDFTPNVAVDLGSFLPPWTLTMDDQVSDEIFVRYPLLVAQNQFTPWRQTGGMVTVHGGSIFTATAGLWNGLDNPDNFVDDNDKTDQMLTVGLEVYPGIRFHVGDWRGDTYVVSGATVVDAEYNHVWLAAELDKGNWDLAAEVLWNRRNPDSGDNLNAFGYQASIAYTWQMFQPVLRYEQFDPDNATDYDELEWTTLGLNVMVGPTTRIMADYIFKAERMDNQQANDEFLVQVSTWF